MSAKAELHPWEWLKKPRHRIHVDHAGPVGGRHYLIIVGAHCKWVDVHATSATTSKGTIKMFETHIFALWLAFVIFVSYYGLVFQVNLRHSHLILELSTSSLQSTKLLLMIFY